MGHTGVNRIAQLRNLERTATIITSQRYDFQHSCIPAQKAYISNIGSIYGVVVVVAEVKEPPVRSQEKETTSPVLPV
jgi:hypothetical protein